MMSLQSHIANFTLRRKMKPMPFHLMDPVALRAAFEEASPTDIPDDITVEKIDGPAMRGEFHTPQTQADEECLFFYCHGGAYIFGSPTTHRVLTFALARGLSMKTFSLDYRLAPEDPFPAAVEDAVAAYEAFLEQGYAPSKIVIGGDSAGGGLVMALCVALRARGLPMPSCQILFSPWSDLSVSGGSIDTNEKSDVMFKSIYIREGAKKVLNGADPTDPLASPLFADFESFPPTILFASKSEILFDDSARLVEKFKNAGVELDVIFERGLAHAWPILVGKVPEAGRACDQAAAFAKRHLGS